MVLLIQGRSRGRIVTFFVGIHCSAKESRVVEKRFAYILTSSLRTDQNIVYVLVTCKLKRYLTDSDKENVETTIFSHSMP